MLGEDFHVGENGHEVGVAGPARNDVQVDVIRHTGSGNSPQVPAEVEALRAVGLGQGAQPLTGEPVQLEDFVVLEVGDLTDVANRRNHQVAGRIREAIEQDERTPAAVDDEPLLVVALAGEAEDAALLLVRGAARTRAATEPRVASSQGRFYQGGEFTATVSIMKRLIVALGIATLLASAGASSVRADHDPANECLGATQTIRGTTGNDALVGTPGPDVIKGLAGDDTIDGGGGRDILCGEEGNDVLLGGDDGDSLDGGLGDDRLDGGPGLDLAFFRWSTAPVTASLVTNSATGEGTDTFVALEGLSGSRLNDVLSGDDGDNILDGVGGDDVLLGQGGIDGLDGDAGNDVLNGGPGIDFVYYLFAPRGITANLGSRKARGWGTDTLRSIEDLEGSPHSDVLTGDGRPNELNGGAGKDRLNGGGGTDSLIGEVGNDSLFGGSGRDGLIGGKGKDFADGGPGRDRCNAEKKRSCP